ncbi:hypothetical protein GUITHDRAFT_113932 [Guillardia theta CCMP2712]|uniref:Mitochondrial inner membrane protease ATP23 n=1 Tax=Guillardia theta (strain CCMP2712) TaxID=905079 RepID=L1IVS2_GUITC|nr:hypothetical protein GUITHDRAFT_113932 [Guillardia theta CCMP2712]EKX39940.1 hypothetical protein GUITHDRAFT_113932 [Guillardia theta CCMP2712]|eukprot:XP_005826920.1 hypothetical protein GUITHDRAFT_113932 [Guillardia theta CCMP2712]
MLGCLRFPKDTSPRRLSSALREPDIHDVVKKLRSMHSLKDLKQTLRHELVHAFDHLEMKMDFRDPSQLACSEIRAASCVDCEKVWKVFKRHCVRHVALRSTTVNFDDKAVCLVQPWLAKTDRLLAACQTATEAVDDQLNYCSLVWGVEERLLQS